MSGPVEAIVDAAAPLAALAPAAARTLGLCLGAMVGAHLGGAVVAAGLRAERPWPRGAARLASRLARAVPEISWLFLASLGTQALANIGPAWWPGGGRQTSQVVAGLVVLSAVYGAYLGEVVAAAVASLAQPGREAAGLLGLSRWRQAVQIDLPQALAQAQPVLSTQLANLVKATSVLSFLGVDELARAGTMLGVAAGQPLRWLWPVALYFCALCALCPWLARRAWRALAVYGGGR